MHPFLPSILPSNQTDTTANVAARSLDKNRNVAIVFVAGLGRVDRSDAEEALGGFPQYQFVQAKI